MIAGVHLEFLAHSSLRVSVFVQSVWTYVLVSEARAAELAKADEALRGSLDALASVPELDDFLGQVMAAITGQLGAFSSTLRVRNFEQNTLPLELIFQDGQVMTPDQANYPENWQSVSVEQFDPHFLYHSPL